MSRRRKALASRWQEAWPSALAAWSPFTRIKPPKLCLDRASAAAEELNASFAMIRLADQAVVIDLEWVERLGIGDYAVEVLAHEIGHHVYAPASITEHTRSLARMLPALPTVAERAPFIANLYTDLLINDRLQRSAGLRMAELMRAIAVAADGPSSQLWTLYLRIYELLWGLQFGSLCGARARRDRIEADAMLASRLVRHHARRWLDGAAPFAMLLLPYLIEEAHAGERLRLLMDTEMAGRGGQAEGLTQMDAEELGEPLHPARDPALGGWTDPDPAARPEERKPANPASARAGQARDPFQYGELLRLAGLRLDQRDAAVRYYRERAQPYLVPFPGRRSKAGEDPLPEGLDPWEPGEPLERIDWPATLCASPQPIPGLTTMQRHEGSQPGLEPRLRPLDLDVYVDSSGSMPDPGRSLSWPALAGAVICLSALRAGAEVQVTLWSGRNQAMSTPGFVRSDEACLRVLTGFYGGATQFPLPILRDTHARRERLQRPCHILVVSDDGASTMFDSPDERGTPGLEVCARALAQAAGGGTLALNLASNWERQDRRQDLAWIRRARDEQGWLVASVATLEDLMAFARAFTRRHYDLNAGMKDHLA